MALFPKVSPSCRPRPLTSSGPQSHPTYILPLPRTPKLGSRSTSGTSQRALGVPLTMHDMRRDALRDIGMNIQVKGALSVVYTAIFVFVSTPSRVLALYIVQGIDHASHSNLP